MNLAATLAAGIAATCGSYPTRSAVLCWSSISITGPHLVAAAKPVRNRF